MPIYLANDKYNATLTQTYTVGDNTLYVDNVPNNVPTIVVAEYGTNNETIFAVTGKTSNALTGVVRLRGANVNLNIGAKITCVNNEEFINQFQSAGEFINQFQSAGFDGWISANETWTYASSDDPTYTLTISGDKTNKYSPGMRIRLKQGSSYLYFIITAVSYSAPNTTLTLYGGTDYDLTNATITDNYYSSVKAPLGFPLNPDKWTVKVTQVSGIWTSSPTANTWYNGKSFSVPTGVWNLSYYTRPYNTYRSGYPSTMRVTISTTNNSETDSELTSNSGVTAGNDGSGFLYVDSILTSSKVITVNSTTTYYFNYGTTMSGMVAVGFSNLIIKLVSVYL